MSENTQILVSVIIPVYDNLTGLREAIKSVKNQEKKQLEIIVVDDGSHHMLRLDEFPEVKLIHHKKNRGAAAARNTGMRQSKGKYIAFLDSDDRWEKGKLEEQFSLMESLPDEVAGVFSPFYYDGVPDKVYNVKLNRNDWFDYFLMGCRVAPGSTLLFRRTLFETIGPQDEKLRCFEDWDWLLQVAKKHRFAHTSMAKTILGSPSRTEGPIVEDCLKIMEEKWLHKLERKSRRKLQAAFELERAALALRKDGLLATLFILVKATAMSYNTVVYTLIWRFCRYVIGNRH